MTRPVRDFRCDRCGVLLKGVRVGDEIHATNRPYTDAQVERCTCADCVEIEKRKVDR